ncbi:hypothetical protein GH733_009779 [Mirounga leonina]|nr:hypothetical protein GH733_009779 [Mirounga leonina]
MDFMKTLKAAKIRVSVIGLSAEVRVCTVLARETGGFPQHTIASLSDQDAKPSFSMAHLDSNTEPGLTLGGYFCPQCRAKYCELPVECKICGLTLVSAPHLARSYHHLFPLDAFQELPLEEHNGEKSMFVLCAKMFSVWTVMFLFMTLFTVVLAVFIRFQLLQELQLWRDLVFSAQLSGNPSRKRKELVAKAPKWVKM